MCIKCEGCIFSSYEDIKGQKLQNRQKTLFFNTLSIFKGVLHPNAQELDWRLHFSDTIKSIDYENWKIFYSLSCGNESVFLAMLAWPCSGLIKVYICLNWRNFWAKDSACIIYNSVLDFFTCNRIFLKKKVKAFIT